MTNTELLCELQKNILLTPMEGIICGETKEYCLNLLETSLNQTLLKTITDYNASIITTSNGDIAVAVKHDSDIQAIINLAFSFTPPTNLVKGELHYRIYKETLKFIIKQETDKPKFYPELDI